MASQCVFWTPQQFADAVASGWNVISGPYDDETTCDVTCNPIIPGVDCDNAGEVPFDYEYPGSILNTENQWLVIHPNTASPCKIEWTSSTTSLAASFSESYDTGDPICPPDAGLGSTTDMTYCLDWTPASATSVCLVRVVASADGTYTWKISLGSC